MTFEAELAGVIDAGFGHATFRFFEVGLTALLAYDYFLTLKDEIHYAWRTENVPIFVIFLFTRYLPMVFQVWLLIYILYPGYTQEEYACAKTIFIPMLYNDIIIALSQVVLTLRTYAITMKNKLVAGILCIISAAEFSIGCYMYLRAATNPLPATPTIPLTLFHACAPNIGITLTIVQMTLPIVFEITVFVLVLVQVKLIKSKCRKVNAPTIIDIINRDAGIYFMLITTFNSLAMVMYFTVKSTSIRGLPVMGNMVLMPMMICRMIISLREAADSPQPLMSIEVPTGTTIELSVFKR